MREARAHGWVARTTEYNLGIEMSTVEREEYNDLKTKFQTFFDKFDNNFGIMKKCAAKPTPKQFTTADGRVIYLEPWCVERAKDVGWRGNSAQLAYEIEIENQGIPKTHRRSVWGGDLCHPYHPEKLQIFAINGMRLMGKMKQFMYKAISKVDAAEKIIRNVPGKVITFAEVCETADLLAARLGPEAVVYHSSLPTLIVNGKKISCKKQKLLALESIKENRARVLCSAKALDEGTDIPDLEWGIITSFTSSGRQLIQRTGRPGRKHIFSSGIEKVARMVTIYLKDTKEYYWMVKAQRRNPSIIWVDTVEDILREEGLLKVEEGLIAQ